MSIDIVRSGGVKVLIQSVENRVSARQMESSTRAILGLATNNALSIKTLVNDGAIGVLKSSFSPNPLPPLFLIESHRCFANAIHPLCCGRCQGTG
jgi:hypothetical protein